jgi:hypothetical protein
VRLLPWWIKRTAHFFIMVVSSQKARLRR